MSSVGSHLSLLDRVVRSAEKLCEGEFCCLEHRRKVSALCLLCKIYHRTDHPLHENLHYFVAALNSRALAALGDLALVMPRCRTDKLRRSFFSAAVHL